MKISGFAYAIAAAVIWGLVYAIDQKILTKVSPFALIFIDSLIILLVSIPFIIFNPEPIRILFDSGKENLWLVFISILLGALATFFIFSGIKILGASTASIFEIAYPFFVIFFSFLLFRTNLNIYFFGGAILIFAGSYVIIRFG